MWVSSSLVSIYKIKERVFYAIEEAIIIGVSINRTRSSFARAYEGPTTILDLVT